jgi:hypothetical protein
LDRVIDAVRWDLKFDRPFLIESKASTSIQPPQTPAPRRARERCPERLQGLVAEGVRGRAPDHEGVRDAARRPPVRPAGRDHLDSRTIPNSRIPARKLSDQRLILAEGDTGQAPDPAIGVTGYSEARARDRGMMRPRIVFKRIEQPGQFAEQPLVRVLKGATPMKRPGQERAFVIESDASEDRLSASLERSKVRGDPIRCDLAVSVSGQDHAVPVTAFHKPGLANVHRRATGGAGVRALGRQARLDDTDVERPAFRQRTSDARALIGAIVGEDDNADQRRRDRAPKLVALLSKGAQAGRKPLLFISSGNGDNKTWLDGQGETWRRRGKLGSPNTGWVVKHEDTRFDGRKLSWLKTGQPQ